MKNILYDIIYKSSRGNLNSHFIERNVDIGTATFSILDVIVGSPPIREKNKTLSSCVKLSYRLCMTFAPRDYLAFKRQGKTRKDESKY